MGFSEIAREWLLAPLTERVSALTSEVRGMSQAINDRLDQIKASSVAEKAEVTAALAALTDKITALTEQVRQGQLDEKQIVGALDSLNSDVKGIYVAPDAPNTGGVETPTGVV